MFVWAPYRLLIYVYWMAFGDKRRHPHMGHRSPLSHWPVLGDTLRVLNLGLVGVVVGGLVLSALHRGSAATIVTDGSSLLMAHQSLAALAFGGAVVATALHQTLD
ncbi:MAG: hypothetical protein ACRDHX_05565, partial [Chloroflexota bacterium]